MSVLKGPTLWADKGRSAKKVGHREQGQVLMRKGERFDVTIRKKFSVARKVQGTLKEGF